MKTLPREMLVEVLLNSLEAERYVRGPLLLTLIDELGASDDLAAAADVARLVLAGIEDRTLDEHTFARRLAQVRELVQGRGVTAA